MRPKLCLVGLQVPNLSESDITAVGTRILDLDEVKDDSVSISNWHLDDYALILFTSGTTGDPKGVVHTHRSLLAQWDSLRVALQSTNFRYTLCFLPTHFGHGLICNCLFPWLAGNTLHILPPFRADTLAQLGTLIDEHSITFLSSVPTAWRAALKLARAPNKGTLNRVFCGSAPLSTQLWSSIRDWTGADVSNAYGITETASWLGGTPFGYGMPVDGFIGEPWGTEFRVLSMGDTNESIDHIPTCKPGEEGNVWVRTPALMRGYYMHDELTSQVIRQGWFHTGDIGVLDDQGYLLLRGREREEINKGGIKIHPIDIDRVIEEFPSVSDVCTFAYTDEFHGEDVGVAVVMDEDDEAKRSELLEWVRHRVASHKLPTRWYLLDEIPQTSRGKINRQTVASHCSELSPVTIRRLEQK